MQQLAPQELAVWRLHYAIIDEYAQRRSNKSPKMHKIMRIIQSMWNAGKPAAILTCRLYIRLTNRRPNTNDPYLMLKALRILHFDCKIVAKLFELRNAAIHMVYKQLKIEMFQDLTKELIKLIEADYFLVKEFLNERKRVYEILNQEYLMIYQDISKLARIGTLLELKPAWLQQIRQRKLKLLDKDNKIVVMGCWDGSCVKVFDKGKPTKIPITSRVEIM
jgi:hypothetical protein